MKIGKAKGNGVGHGSFCFSIQNLYELYYVFSRVFRSLHRHTPSMSNRKRFPFLRASWGNPSLSTLEDQWSRRELGLVTMIDGNFQWSLKSYHHSLFLGQTTRWVLPTTLPQQPCQPIMTLLTQCLSISGFILILTCTSLSHLTSNRTHLR